MLTLFFFQYAFSYHPDLTEQRRNLKEKHKESQLLAKAMLDMIIKRIWTLEGRFAREALHSRVRLLESGHEAGLQNSIEIINTLKYFSDDTSKLLKLGSRHTDAIKRLVEVVATHNVFLGKLIPLDEVKGTTTRRITNLAGKFDDVSAIFHCLENILNLKEFSISEAETMQASIRKCQHDLDKSEERVHNTMISKARVLMSTIGSSHKLPVKMYIIIIMFATIKYFLCVLCAWHNLHVYLFFVNFVYAALAASDVGFKKSIPSFLIF